MDSVRSEAAPPQALKILVAGGFGAGKTTLVGSVSEIPPLRTEEVLTTAGVETDDTTGVARFLATKGEGFHHVCFEVENLSETLTRLELDGLELIDTAPRKGAEGPVAFIHPRSCHGVLVELIEAPGGPSWASLGYP